MKKKFPCGHVGKGQYCHLCKAKDDAYEAERAEKRAQKQAISEKLNVGVDLERLPTAVALKAAETIRKLRSGTHYLELNGKRLTNWDHSIISIPVGWYRIMCRDNTGIIVPVEVVSHEEYNNHISKARR